MGQKDDTRENSCVTVRARASERVREREGERGEGREDRRREDREEITGRKTERDWLDRKRKATHISIF